MTEVLLESHGWQPEWLDRGVFVHETAVVDDGAFIGSNTRVWHFSHIMAGAQIGRGCNLGQNVFMADGSILGNFCKVQNNVSLYRGVECEDCVFLGPSCVFTNVFNPRAEVNRSSFVRPTPVRVGATVCANATIVCGNEIGSYALVGAGAVVTEKVLPYSQVVGVPAKPAGWRCECGEKLTLPPVSETLGEDPQRLQCGVCGLPYVHSFSILTFTSHMKRI